MIRGGQEHHPSRTYAVNKIVEFGGSVLECGLGSGVDTKQLIEAGLEYHGIDLSPAIVQNLSLQFPKATIREGSITQIEYDNNSFTTTYTRHVLEHLPHDLINQATNELTRIAKKQVIITLFMSPSKDNSHGRWVEDPGNWDNDGFWEHHVSIRDIKTILGQKFKIITTKHLYPPKHLAEAKVGRCEPNWVIVARN